MQTRMRCEEKKMNPSYEHLIYAQNVEQNALNSKVVLASLLMLSKKQANLLPCMNYSDDIIISFILMAGRNTLDFTTTYNHDSKS